MIKNIEILVLLGLLAFIGFVAFKNEMHYSKEIKALKKEIVALDKQLSDSKKLYAKSFLLYRQCNNDLRSKDNEIKVIVDSCGQTILDLNATRLYKEANSSENNTSKGYLWVES